MGSGRGAGAHSRRRHGCAAGLLCWVVLACASGGSLGPGASGSSPAPGTGDTPGTGGGAPRSAPEADAAAPDSPFPNVSRLEELAEEAGPAGLLDFDFAEVDRWQLSGPFPERVGDEPIRDPLLFEEPLVAAAGRRAGLLVASEAMRCVAREIGLFLLEHERLPGAALQRFVHHRCGGTGSGVQVGYFGGGVPPNASTETVFDAWRERVEALVQQHLGAGPRAAGLWYGQRGELGLVVLASAHRSVLLNPVSAVPDADGWLRLQGELLEPSDEVFANVNHGAFGYADCEIERGVALPRFSIACPLERGDETTWVQVSARRPGRILADGVLMVLARPMGAHADTFVRRSYGTRLEIASGEELTRQLFDQVNRIRRRAGARPLELARDESQVATALAPAYLGATYGRPERGLADLAALGLMAGWRVPGVVRDGQVSGVLVPNTRQLDRWLAEALQHPNFREVMLSPDRTLLAIGSVVSEEPAYLGAVVASYALFEPEGLPEALETWYRRLQEGCAARGASPLERDRQVDEAAARHLLRVREGRAAPAEALADLLEEASALLGAPVQGWVVEAPEADTLALPEPLLAGGMARVGAGIDFYQPAGWPWGRTLGFVVAMHHGAPRSAQRGPGSGGGVEQDLQHAVAALVEERVGVRTLR